MKRTIIEIICILFMILFLYTGINKLMELSVFEEQIKATIFKPLATLIAWGLPITEIIVALSLLIPDWRLKGLYASLSLMAIFTIYVVGLVSFASELPCSCGGILQELSWPQHIVFNSTFLMLALGGIRLYKSSLKDKAENSVNSNSLVNPL